MEINKPESVKRYFTLILYGYVVMEATHIHDWLHRCTNSDGEKKSNRNEKKVSGQS